MSDKYGSRPEATTPQTAAIIETSLRFPSPPSPICVVGDDVNGWRSGVRAAASATEPVNGLSSTEAVVAFGTDGRSGFGTGSTGARVTIGGAILVEQVGEKKKNVILD